MTWRCYIKLPDINILVEIIIRFVLFGIFILTDEMEPFHRIIQPEEMWLYKNPVTSSYATNTMLYIIITVIPLTVIIMNAVIKGEKKDLKQAILVITLTMALIGVLTNCVKLIVGRPRPDFFWRCFPDGKSTLNMKCTGDPAVITQGRKSFPSGHSSFAFAALGFTSLYLAGKLRCFATNGRGSAWKLCLVGFPLIIALCVALSRTADYHHHWQDVLVGSILGLAVAFLCYRQHYPAITHPQCEHCYDMPCDIASKGELKLPK